MNGRSVPIRGALRQSCERIYRNGNDRKLRASVRPKTQRQRFVRRSCPAFVVGDCAPSGRSKPGGRAAPLLFT